MQLQINSANIATFFVKVSFDVYNRRVIFDTSGTTYNGAGASAVLGISFSLIDQSGVELANGGLNWANPQIKGPVTSGNWIWTLDLSSLNFAFLFQNYQIIAAIQDADGTVYQTIPVFKNLCQPQSITDSGYVPGLFQIIPDTINSTLTVKELTQLVYNSLAPTSVSKSGVLSYPTGTIAAINFTNTPFSNNVIYTGQYRINCTTIATYSILDDVYVLVSYITNNVFPVTVANKMADLMCCVQKIQRTAEKNCDNAIGEAAKQQMLDILPYMMTGFIAETAGQDASPQADYIRKYLACDCGPGSISQSEFTPINPAVTSIVITGAGGTSVPAPTITGNTSTYAITSSVYQVVKGNTGDLAFSIATDTSTSNTVKYVLTINYDVFAGSILNAIAADPSLLNQLNNMVSSGAFSAAGLNGKCIIDLTKSDYSLAIAVNGSTLISNIVINGVTYNAPSNLFANSAAPILTWLTSLSLGTFTVTVSLGVLTIASAANTNIISTMTFTTPNVTQLFQSTKATQAQIFQALFNYICSMTALQVALGNNLSLCTFDYNGNLVTTTYTGTGATPASQNDFNAGISNAICNIANRILALTGVTCATLKAMFQDYPSVPFGSSDRVYGTLGNNCAGLTDQQLANVVLLAANKYADVKANFCAIDCTVPATCPDVSSINKSVVTGNIGIYGITWGVTPLAIQTVTVNYRVSGTTPWLTSTNSLSIFPNGNINGNTPYLITGLTAGVTYDIQVINNCGGVGSITQATVPTGTVYTGSYLVSGVLYSLCGGSPMTLYSSVPFGTGATMYTNIGLTTPLTGNLYITLATGGGNIFQISSTTGTVGANTLSSCGSGVSGTYILGNSTGSICTGSPVTLYTNGSFTVGTSILYSDSALTTPVTGSAYVVYNSVIYNVNTSTGVVTSSTGLSCSTNVTIANHTSNGNISAINNITGFASVPVAAGVTVTGSHTTFTAGVQVFFGAAATASTNLVLLKNFSVVQTIPISGGDGTTRTFSTQTFNTSDVLEIIWS